MIGLGERGRPRRRWRNEIGELVDQWSFNFGEGERVERERGDWKFNEDRESWKGN